MAIQKDRPYPGYPGWTEVYCCQGMYLSATDSIEECEFCHGERYYARHNKTGTLALYPGGKLIGKEKPVDAEA